LEDGRPIYIWDMMYAFSAVHNLSSAVYRFCAGLVIVVVLSVANTAEAVILRSNVAAVLLAVLMVAYYYCFCGGEQSKSKSES
jgi:hypothetical protein